MLDGHLIAPGVESRNRRRRTNWRPGVWSQGGSWHSAGCSSARCFHLSFCSPAYPRWCWGPVYDGKRNQEIKKWDIRVGHGCSAAYHFDPNSFSSRRPTARSTRSLERMELGSYYYFESNARSEERRVGKECRLWVWTYH